MSRSALVRCIVGAMCVVLFSGLATAVEMGATMGADLRTSAALAPFRSASLLALFGWITTMGTGASLTGMALAASALLWSSRRGALLLPLWVTFLGAEATTWVAKFVFDRPRPGVLSGVAAATSPSFPSAHATATGAAIGILACLITRDLAGRMQRVVSAGVAAVIIGLIGFSRVFLNLHYCSDVLAGFLVAGFWVLIGSGLAAPRASAGGQDGNVAHRG